MRKRLRRKRKETNRALSIEMTNNPSCPYCGGATILCSSSVVYGKDYGQIYLCERWPKCDAYVGVHKGTIVPKGTVANKELRFWRKEAHNAFDMLWRKGSITGRKKAYDWLQKHMNLSREEAHIGKFSIEQCQKLIGIIRNSEHSTDCN